MADNKSNMNSETSTKPSTTRSPLTEEQMKALDEKYQAPQNMGHFLVYFGKYRGTKTFAEVVLDEHYTRFVMSLKPATSNIYLFQRYVKAVSG